MDWRAMLRDRRLWLGAGVAAAIGAVVYLRRRSSGGGGAESVASRGATGSPAIDTTGTDIASWLGQYSGSLDRRLVEYGDLLTETLSAIGQPRPGGTPDPNAPGAPQRVSVQLGTNVYDWLKGLNRSYGLSLDLNVLRDLNPGLDKRLQWTDRGPGQPKVPSFKAGTGPVAIR